MAGRMQKVLLGVGSVAVVLGTAGYVVYGGGKHQDPGTVHPKPVPPKQVEARAERQPDAPKQVLFGDLHVHTTFSADAFMRSLPLMGGEGAHPPADACDFARFCSGLDFFSINDHAESLTPQRWQETKDSIRQCNAVAGDAKNPDLVAFVGWEWSHVGATPEEHYGHKNVIFRDLAEDKLPTRPIGAPGLTRALRNITQSSGQWWSLLAIPVMEFSDRDRYLDLVVYGRETRGVDDCPRGVKVRDLPVNCREAAATPKELFSKLGDWGFDTLVIPHGTTWGFYTPPGYSYAKQVESDQDDPEKQRLMEIYSGHGNSEEYRDWRAVNVDDEGRLSCPEPTPGYEPCCWRAGEIIRSRCGDAPKQECERRVREARANYVAAGVAGHLTVSGAMVDDWKDCGQCRDCFNPAFNYRPAASAQYALAKTSFENGQKKNLKLGFIASSDNHSARPGTGYKEYARREMTEATGPKSEKFREMFFGKRADPAPESKPLPEDAPETVAPFRLVNLERQASFFMTGGLVAVHSAGRSRDQIWEALKRREVYGTSGERILLWFDMVGEDKLHPMGSEVKWGGPPRFRVRALGAFEQKPGCPDWSAVGIGEERLARLCLGECYNPDAKRRRITRIEVVRIRPQRQADESIAALVEDAWKTFECPGSTEMCEVSFQDPDFVTGQRDAVYYVRAIQEPTLAVNAGQLRCKRDERGNCVETKPCYGDYRTSFQDDCMAKNEERAWSSPIFVAFDAEAASAQAAGEAGTDAGEEARP